MTLEEAVISARIVATVKKTNDLLRTIIMRKLHKNEIIESLMEKSSLIR